MNTFFIFVFIFVHSKAFGGPQFSEEVIDHAILQVKKTQKIPDHAIDIIFDFYKNNRESVRQLENPSCLKKKEYRVRSQDVGLRVSDLLKGIKNESCLCIMDYTAAKDKKRGHCIFLKKEDSVTVESFFVAHGSGSQEKRGVPTLFTNKLSSTGTTLSGLHLTAEKTYSFHGKAKAYGAYSSTGLALYGVEKDNWTAAIVGKVSHGAPYVNDDPKHFFVGRSHGCPAMTVEKAKSILPQCRGRAAWLNYTTEVQKRKHLKPEYCSP